MAIHQLVLTSILNFSLPLEIVTIWQTDSIAHKLKPRLFHKSTYLWVHLADFYSQCKLHLTVLSDSQVCCSFWAVSSAKPSVVVLPAKNNFYTSKFKIASSCHNFSNSTLILLLGTPFNTILCFSNHLAYSLNAPWCLRQFHQRGQSSLRSPSSIIQPG